MEKIIEFLKNLFKGEKKETFSSTNEIIRNSLPRIASNHLNPRKDILLDKKYTTMSISDFKDLLSKDFTNFKFYSEDYDCDNFAFKLHSNIKNKYPTLSFGIVISTSHAFNVFVDKFGVAYYVEPQSDKTYIYSKLPDKYKPLTLVII